MQRSLSMERNGTPLCFTMFSMRLLYPIIARIALIDLMMVM